MSTLIASNLQASNGGGTAATLASINGGPIGNRNCLINGGFDVWQRGTSQTTTGYGSVDRWNLTVAGTCTFSQETSVVPSGAQYALKWTTGAASSYGQARQFIEQLNVIPLRGQTLSASAYVRSGGTFTGNVVFEIGYSTTTDASSGSYTVISTTTSGTVNSSSYTQIKTTFTVPSNAVGLFVGIVPNTVQGNGATVYQSLAQLEPGSVATPFERRSYGQELALCQRYYYRLKATAVNKIFSNGGLCYASTAIISTIQFPVTMRTEPTALEQSGTAGDYRVYNSAGSAIALNAVPTFGSNTTTSTATVEGTVASGLSAGNSTQLLSATTSAYLGWSAEL